VAGRPEDVYFSDIVKNFNHSLNSKSLTQTIKSNINKMDNLHQFFLTLYDKFNERRMDLVIANMTENVKWANGMDGGYVYGHDAVKEYWTRQFKLISSNVRPLEIKEENGKVIVKVHQVVHDLDGKLLADEIVYHFFQLKDNKIVMFEIGEKK
jgi:SnoaL-like domain